MPHEHLPRRAALIVNTRSREGRAGLKAAERLLREQGVQLSLVRGIDNPDLLAPAIREALATSVPIIIVGGGDGSLLAAVQHFEASGSAMGVLPLGTANSFARSLAIPLDLEGAVDVIARGSLRKIDLGAIDGTLYAGCASVGLAPQIAETIPHGLKGWLGRPGYLLWAAVQLARFRPFRLTVEIGKKREIFDAVEVRIANGAYHGGVKLVDEAHLDSGKIVVQAVVGQKRRHLLLNWAAHIIGADRRWRQVRQFEGASIRLSSEPPMPISIDGEVLARMPVVATVKPRAMLVVAPPRPTGRTRQLSATSHV
jgi:YegS/Rv2252/BmrU family lipid kinase